MSMKLSAPRGTRDILPDETPRWQWMEAVLRRTAARFGFREIRFPVFEHTELFLRGIGGTTDIVQKEMYTFLDKGDRSITLRPEGTASVVRAVLEHGLHLQPMPLKLFYIAPNFRYENPQKGRLRQHYQFGAECFGSAEPSADAETIALAAACMDALGLAVGSGGTGVSLHINSIGCPTCRPAYHAKLLAYLEAEKSSLCADCQTRMERNPLRVLRCKREVCHATAQKAPCGVDHLCDDCKAHMERLKDELRGMGLSFAVNPLMVRGLDYYTRTVFEFPAQGIGAQSAVCGGGRYDGLSESLGGPPLPALGFGSGLERLLMTLEAQGAAFPAPPPCDVYLAALGENAARLASSLCHDLRGLGFWAERDLCARTLKAQMKYADKLGARYTLVIGDTELETGRAEMKDMASGEKRGTGLTARDIADRL